MERILHKKHQELEHLKEGFKRHSFEQVITQKLENVTSLRGEMQRLIAYRLERFASQLPPLEASLNEQISQQLLHVHHQITQLQNGYKSADPALRTKRGYAQIGKAGKVVALDELHVNDKIDLMDDKNSISATVTDVKRL